MNTDTRTPGDIERDIEANRDRLTSNLDELQDRFSLDGIVRQFTDQMRANGGDLGQAFYDNVRANPLPVALTGIGLLWMMFGSGPSASALARGTNHHSADGLAGDSEETRLRGDRPDVPNMMAGTRVTWKNRDNAPSWAISNGVSAAGSALRDSAESARQGAADLGSRIAEGTESFTEEARQRVVEARRKAMDWQRQGAQSLSAGLDATAGLYDRQPLVAGALALAFGAALATALPRTATEDDLMGRESDNLLHEAERIFAEERDKAERVAAAALAEADRIAREGEGEGQSHAPSPDDRPATEPAEDAPGEAATQFAESNLDSAEEDDFGKPRA